jgi:FkbM family methyltransferase
VITDTALRSGSALGRVARLPLRLIPPRAELPILSGPLRGRRWIAGSSSHGCWLGTYEAAVLRAFAARIRPGMVVYDVGANVGLFTLAAVSRGARVIAFEPDARNRAFLARHLALNQPRDRARDRVEIVAAAVGRTAGRARYRPERTGLEGRVAPDGTVEIDLVALDGLDRPAPDVVKVDVEGGELDVLEGAVERLRTARPIVFLEVHDDREAPCRALLASLGYRMTPLGDARRFVAEP